MVDRPIRSSRGSRITKLVGEAAEADKLFWDQSAWNEDLDDEDYSTEDEEEDIVDDDFDAEEIPDDEVHDEGVEKRPTRRSGRPKSIYSGRIVAAAQRKTTESHITIENTNKLQPITSRPRVFQYEAPQVRQSTSIKSSESSEMRRMRPQVNPRKKVLISKANRMSQYDLIKEAVRTEIENTRSLNQMEQWQEEKKAELNQPKAPFTGLMVRYHSRIGAPKTISFLNTEQFPSIFHDKPRKRRLIDNKRRHRLLNINSNNSGGQSDNSDIKNEEDELEEEDMSE